NGLGLSFVSAVKQLMAACSSTIDVKTARLRRCRVSLANRPSTALTQEQEVGVKWKVKRGCRASQAVTFGCLWVAQLSSTTWTVLSAGTSPSMALRKRIHS